MFKILKGSFAFLMLVALTSAVPPFKTSNLNSQNTSLNSKKVTVQEVINMSPKKYEELTGEKLNFKGKIVFSMLKDELKKTEIDKTETIDLVTTMADTNSTFSWGGFFVGLLLGIIGVGLVYIFSDDSNVRRSSWKGLGAWLILLIIAATL